MPRPRRVATGAAVAAALISAAAYGAIRLADSMNGDLGTPGPAVASTAARPMAPGETREPSAFGFGKPLARAAGGEVVAYAPRHEAERMLTIPFTLTNRASKPLSISATVTVTVTAGESTGTTENLTVDSDGLLRPGTTISAEPALQSLGAIPDRDLEIRITHVERRDSKGYATNT